jgi:hypothetical protein
MEKIIFKDLKGLIEVFSSNHRNRMVLSHSDANAFMWRGSEGLYTDLLMLFDFHKKYLSNSKEFNDLVHDIHDVIKSIPESEFHNQIIDKDRHKKTLYLIIDILDKFEQLIVHYYTMNTLFQFSNITFNSDILFSRVDEVFENDTWAFIPTTARKDIIEGGRALLFNLPTCASFMFLRALEDCIRKLCNRLGYIKNNITFGKAIHILEKEKDKFNTEELVFERQVNFMKYVKDEFRNPSAHPEKTFSQKEAEQLFQVVNVGIDKLRFLHNGISTNEND